MNRWGCSVVVKVKVTETEKGFNIPVNVHVDDMPLASEPSVTKLGMVMQHHGPKCPARRLVCCLQSVSYTHLTLPTTAEV